MHDSEQVHNRFKEGLPVFLENDPHLLSLSRLQYQHAPDWWKDIPVQAYGIYILSGGRQVGKSTSVKLFIADCIQTKRFLPEHILYLPCDEIFDAKDLSQRIRRFVDTCQGHPFLLAIDEVTFVPHWDRIIKSLADEGHFTRGLCLLTGSDTLILKEASMSFPGRRGESDQTDFHVYPLSFKEYVALVQKTEPPAHDALPGLFQNYLQTGGYLRAINDFASHGAVLPATYHTYEQWIRGDFLKRGKNEAYLLALLQALFTVGISQISYSALTHKIGLMSKETCLDYCELLKRMDILFDLEAFDQNKKRGFPKKDRKFHFQDPFIQRTLYQWLRREGYIESQDFEPALIESTVASHCHRFAKTYYFKGHGEIDVIYVKDSLVYAVEVKWSTQLRPNDLKMLKQFPNSIIVTKSPQSGIMDGIPVMPVWQFLITSCFALAQAF